MSGQLAISPEDLALQSTVQFLAGDTEMLKERSDVLGELNILDTTKGLSGQKREELTDEIMRVRAENQGHPPLDMADTIH